MTLRLLTLIGWWILVVSMIRVVVAHGAGMSRGGRSAWLMLICMHAVIALNSAAIEFAWVLWTVRPESPLIAVAQDIYNSLYLINGAVAAGVPFLILASLLTVPRARGLSILGAGGVAVFTLVVEISEQVDDWSTLMQVSQTLSFVTIGGLLLFWVGVLLGRIPRTDVHLLGVIAVITVFQLLLPIQAEFFNLVGHGELPAIWNVHQWLQFAHVVAEIVIVAAFLRQRAGLRHRQAGATHVVASSDALSPQ